MNISHLMLPRFKQWVAHIRRWIRRYTHSPLCLQCRKFRRSKWSESITGKGRTSILLFRTTLVVNAEKVRIELLAWLGLQTPLSIAVPLYRRITVEIGTSDVKEVTEITMLEKFEALRVYWLARKKSRQEVRAEESRFVNECN